MTTVAAPITELPEQFRPLHRSEYEQLCELGVFEGVPVELVGGVLVEMSPPGPEHIGIHIWLTMRLASLCGDDLAVSAQNPLAVDDISEPQPDLAVIPAQEFRSLRQIPDRAVLVIEIAKTSTRFDLGEKARRYATAGFGEYWVIDVQRGVVHVHRTPRPDGTWGTVVEQTEGPLVVIDAPQLTLDAAEVLARPPAP